jgi:hypothetical protein
VDKVLELNVAGAGAAKLKRDDKLELLELDAEVPAKLKRDDRLELLEVDAEGDGEPKKDERLELLELEEFEEKPENNSFTRLVVSLLIACTSCSAWA